MTVVRLSQSFPQLGLDKDTLRDEFIEYRLQDDAEMPKDLSRQALGLYGVEENSWWTNFQQSWYIYKNRSCAYLIQTHLAQEPFPWCGDWDLKQNQFVLWHSVRLCVLLGYKLNCDCRAVGFKPSKVGLNAAKKATYKYNQAHKS